MKFKQEILLIIMHILIAIAISMFRPLARLYEFSIIIFLSYYVIKAKDKEKAILIASAYIGGSDVFIKMTGAEISSEMHKYLISIFMLIGIISRKGLTRGWQYLIFILLLIPAAFVGEYSLEEEVRKYVAFNLSGPFCLAISSYYLFKRKIRFEVINQALSSMLFPMVTMVSYLFFYVSTSDNIFLNTSSNFKASGGYGPNQVSTIIGIGLFIIISRLVLTFKFLNKRTILNMVLLIFFAYRGIITFSRGGVLTALIASTIFIGILYLYANGNLKFRIFKLVGVFVVIGFGVWTYASMQTDGLIDKRYANEDAIGRKKSDVSTGRGTLIEYEIQAFKENPLFGIGIGKVKQYRYDFTGRKVATHNELSRIIAEHGLLGIIAMLILFISPFIIRLSVRSNIYFYSFILIWLLTINHSATRIAAPAFIYALSLIDIQYGNRNLKKY